MRLAVAVADAGENPQYLEVALHPHQPGLTKKGVEPLRQFDTRRPRLLPIAPNPVLTRGQRQIEEGIGEQRGDVIAGRAVQRVLKVQHSRLARCGHQIARHIVPMHEQPALRHMAGQQNIAQGLPVRPLLRRQRTLQMSSDEPVGKQRQLAAQYRLIVIRQFSRAAAGLPAQQSTDGPGEQAFQFGIAHPGLDALQIGACAQVFKQQKALLWICSENGRRLYPSGSQQAGDTDKGPHVFLLRWRVHDDQAVRPITPAKITTKTRIGTGRLQLAGSGLRPALQLVRLGQRRGQPSLQQTSSCIHLGVSCFRTGSGA